MILIWIRSLILSQTGAVKKVKNVVQVRQIESEREIVPQKYAGDATYETQIDTERDRFVLLDACPLNACASWMLHFLIPAVLWH